MRPTGATTTSFMLLKFQSPLFARHIVELFALYEPVAGFVEVCLFTKECMILVTNFTGTEFLLHFFKLLLPGEERSEVDEDLV